MKYLRENVEVVEFAVGDEIAAEAKGDGVRPKERRLREGERDAVDETVLHSSAKYKDYIDP